MTLGCVRSVWTSRLTLLAPILALVMAGCTAILPPPAAAPAASARMAASDDDDYSQLVAQLRSDLNRYNSREVAQKRPAWRLSAVETTRRNSGGETARMAVQHQRLRRGGGTPAQARKAARVPQGGPSW